MTSNQNIDQEMLRKLIMGAMSGGGNNPMVEWWRRGRQFMNQPMMPDLGQLRPLLGGLGGGGGGGLPSGLANLPAIGNNLPNLPPSGFPNLPSGMPNLPTNRRRPGG